MESKQLKHNIKDTLINKAENYYKKAAENIVLFMKFDVGKELNICKYRLVAAAERALRYNLKNDFTLNETDLENIKNVINE